jgi:hypothetical protein
MDFKCGERPDIINYYVKKANTSTTTIQPLYVSLSISLPAATLYQSHDEPPSKRQPSQWTRIALSSARPPNATLWISAFSNDVPTASGGILSISRTKKRLKRPAGFESITTN